MTRQLRALLLLTLGALLALVAGGPAWADGDQATITHVKAGSNGIKVLVSVPAGAQVDLNGITVSVEGKDAAATATLASDDVKIKRTTVLAIDTSNSMRGARFTAAVDAANTYLDTVPDDVYVGVTTFAGEVEQTLPPTLDRGAARNVLAGLTLSKDTRLYDGVIAATEMAGSDGQRSILVLSDGADTSKTSLDDVTAAVSEAEVLVDVVALEQNSKNLAPLQSMADAGHGTVIKADSAALRAAFSDEADVLSRQILVSAEMPEGVTAAEGTIKVTLPTGTGELTASAFGPLAKPADSGDGAAAPAPRSSSGGFALPSWAMYVGVGLVGIGLVVVFTGLVPRAPKTEFSPDERVTMYTSSVGVGASQHVPERETAIESAKQATALMLRRNQSLEARIAGRLEAAGSQLKPAEWLLLHVSIMVTAGMVGLLLTKSFLVSAIFAAIGIALPWFYLGFRRGRRLKAFNSSLPDTLQLMAGSLQAGLSLAQSVDTIVREGTEPIAGEFKRVLIETRLGVTLEDALEGITERFESKDFAWVVMAIKIQRQVGGNLAELLHTVAATIREREYMRRQVAALAAEGKLSAIVIGGLPPAFLIYLLLINRDYVMPMFTTPMGWVLLGGAAVLLGVGGFWMSRLVKVEV